MQARKQRRFSNPHAGMQGLGDWKPTEFEGSKVDPNLVGTPEVENKDIYWKGMRNGYDERSVKLDSRMETIKDVGRRKDADDITERIQNLYGEYDNVDTTSNPMTNTDVSGLNPRRMALEMTGSLSGDMTPDQIEEMYRNILAPHKKGLDKNDKQAVDTANKDFDKGMMQLKIMQYKQLKRLEKTYGTLGSQMHPEDFSKQANIPFAEQTHFIQDAYQMMDNGGGKYFDFENNEQDKEFKRLANYFGKVAGVVSNYGEYRNDEEKAIADDDEEALEDIKVGVESLGTGSATAQDEKGIGGPKMNKKALKNYQKGLKERAGKGGWMHRLFGKFK